MGITRIPTDPGALNLLGALLVLPGYLFLGAWFKALTVPYVAYLVFRGRARDFPALLVYFMPGTFVSQVILVCCGVRAFLQLRRIRRQRLLAVFMLYTASLAPIVFVSLTHHWDGGLIDAGIYGALALAPFAFFYGSLIASTFDERVARRVLVVLLVALMVELVQSDLTVVRYIFLTVPLLVVLIISGPFFRQGYHLGWAMWMAVCAGLFVVAAGGVEKTFILVLTSFIAVLLVVARAFSVSRRFARMIGPVLAIVCVVASMVLAGVGREGVSRQPAVQGIQDVQQLSDIAPAIEFKMFGDRGALWRAAWEGIRTDDAFWPPVEPKRIRAGTRWWGDSGEIDYGAHNIGFEYLRNYGWLAGVGCILTYLFLAGLSVSGVWFESEASLLVPISATVVATMYVGGLFGHFVAGNTFSLLLFGLAGVGYARSVLWSTARRQRGVA